MNPLSLAQPLMAVSRCVWRSPSSVLVFVRTATKKAAGSKTSNKDSSGRRLGAKKSDGQFVRTGEIIYRQRGTLFFPGENAGIGTDHTIFAKEPGFVRFYLDPFHPRRKFVGVALRKELRLPTPHFSPRIRRLGVVPIIDPIAAEKERTNMSRKEFLSTPLIKEEFERREKSRNEKREKLKVEIKSYISDLEEAELFLASERALNIKTYMAGGRPQDESRLLTDSDKRHDLQLSLEVGRISQEELDQQLSQYSQLTEQMDSSIQFDPSLNLSKVYSESELEEMAKKNYESLVKLSQNEKVNEEDIQALINSPCFDLSKRASLRKRFLFAVKPVSLSKRLSKKELSAMEKNGKGSLIRQWNYDTEKVELVYIEKSLGSVSLKSKST